MSTVKRVLIVGGGIAGMSMAIELRKRAIDVDLVEADPQWRVYGAGITVNAASVRALQKVGVLDAILREGALSEGLDLFLANGTPIGSIPAIPAAGSTVAGSVGILRPALARILSAATTASGTRVRLGTTFTSIDARESGVEVSLSDGSSGRYDLLIGADGLHSKVRTALFPDAPRPRYTGQVCWRAVVPRPPEIRRAAMFLGQQLKAGLVPVSEREMYLFFLETRDSPDHIEPGQWPQILRRALAGFGGPVATIREELTDDSRLNYRPLFALMMPKPWFHHRAVLIGDAAHATTPHLAAGAGLAVEDAIVLAEEIDNASGCEDALSRFVTRRFERCRLVVENSVRLGDIERGAGNSQEHEQLMRDSTAALMAAI